MFQIRSKSTDSLKASASMQALNQTDTNYRAIKLNDLSRSTVSTELQSSEPSIDRVQTDIAELGFRLFYLAVQLGTIPPNLIFAYFLIRSRSTFSDLCICLISASVSVTLLSLLR